MRTKDFTARVKAAGVADGLQEGQFRALVSVFGNEDSAGDVIAPGAFGQVLAEWKATGDPIPVVWAHQWADPFAHIGSVLEAAETPEGLEVLAQIEDMDENPTAAQVYRRLKGRRIKQFSFAYEVAEGGWVETDDTAAHRMGGYYEIKRFSSLFEVGPCLVGVNQETDLIAAKAMGLAHHAKAGRVLSQRNFESLTAAYEAIGEVLGSAQPEKAADRSATHEPGQPVTETADGDAPSAQLSEGQPAKGSEEENPSSVEHQATPSPREGSPEDAAKAGTASPRLRTELELLEFEASLSE